VDGEGGGSQQKKVSKKSFSTSFPPARITPLGDLLKAIAESNTQPFVRQLAWVLCSHKGPLRMSSFARPVPSTLAAVDFSIYSSDDIKKISVKRIFNTPSLDSLNNPVPSSLYDPALGAWGDHM
jgi:hypothetical protein